MQGAAYVFVKAGTGWVSMTETAKLTASDGAADDGFGISAAIDGDTVVAGAAGAAIGSNTQQGAVYVFQPRPETAGAVVAPAVSAPSLVTLALLLIGAGGWILDRRRQTAPPLFSRDTL